MTVMDRFSRIMDKQWTDGGFREKENLEIGSIKPIPR